VTTYAEFLRYQGEYVLNVEGVDWWGYGGFLMPAYLPHKIPEITPRSAHEALRVSGSPFIRWETQFGALNQPWEWWHVLKRGQWDLSQIPCKKRRYLIRQGRKNFQVRLMKDEEVLELAPLVAQAATSRYKGFATAEDRALLFRRLEAGRRVLGVLEYVGCFRGDRLVSWAENHVHDGGVWMTTIRHDPDFLHLSSSYGLVDGLLDIYLNQRKADYVLDGCRNIHHRTEFQSQLEKAFAFERVFSKLNVIYGRWFGLGVWVASPFSGVVFGAARRYPGRLVDNVAAALRQERIRRSFL
jgi:hypothetical protein